MNIPLIDRSNYLKGLFITAKLDKELTHKEKDILKTISQKLGFASDFYSEVVRSLMTNKYIKPEPIIFSEKRIALSFLEDAIHLACCNNLVTSEEINWLKETAEVNQISKEFVDNEILLYKDSPKSFLNRDFSLYSII